MKIKTGDKVKLITGKDKGKTGKVLQVFPETGRASIENVNLLIKHLRPNKRGEKGQRVEFPAAMDLSNVMLVCPKCKKTTRVGHQFIDKKIEDRIKKQKVRVCKKCKEII